MLEPPEVLAVFIGFLLAVIAVLAWCVWDLRGALARRAASEREKDAQIARLEASIERTDAAFVGLLARFGVTLG